MRLHICFLIRQLFPFLYPEVIRPAPTEGKWGVMENRDYWCFSIKIMNIHSVRNIIKIPLFSPNFSLSYFALTISFFTFLLSLTILDHQ